MKMAVHSKKKSIKGEKILVATTADGGKTFNLTGSGNDTKINGKRIVNKANPNPKEIQSSVSEEIENISKQDTKARATDNTWIYSTTQYSSVYTDYGTVSLIAGALALVLPGVSAYAATAVSLATGVKSLGANNMWFKRSTYVSCVCPAALTRYTTVFYLDSDYDHYYDTVFHWFFTV